MEAEDLLQGFQKYCQSNSVMLNRPTQNPIQVYSGELTGKCI